MEGPSVLRLWPGLYFNSDSDADIENGGGKSIGGKKKKKLVKGEGLSATLQVSVHRKKEEETVTTADLLLLLLLLLCLFCLFCVHAAILSIPNPLSLSLTLSP